MTSTRPHVAAGRFARAFVGVVAFALALVAATAVAAPTPAGTVIRNQALATIAGEQVVPSNRVDTIVQEVCVPRLGPAGAPDAPGLRAEVVPPSTAYLPYLLVNEGNVTSSFDLSTTLAPGSAWTPQSVTVHVDDNGDGLVDASEPAVTSVDVQAGAFARIVVAVATPPGASGAVPLTPVADCADATSNEAYALVEAREPLAPALRIELATTDGGLDPSGARRYHVTADLTNYGGGPSDEPTLRLDLAALRDAGLDVDLATIASDKGILVVRADGAWTPGPVAPGTDIDGVGLDLAALVPDESARLTFDVLRPDAASPGIVPITAEAQAPDAPDSARTVTFLSVPATHAHALERVGPDDVTLIEAQPFCTPFDLTNTGTASEAYTFSTGAAPALPAGRLTLETPSGLPLPDTVALAPGATLQVALCADVHAPMTGPATLTLSAHGASSGATVDATVTVLSVLAAEGLVLYHAADPVGTVERDEAIAYTLEIRNAFPFALHDVRVRNDVDADVDVVPGAATYSDATHVARWSLGTIEPGERVEVRLDVTVASDAADDTVIDNRFAVTAAEAPDPVLSSTIRHATWSSALLLDTSVTPSAGATYGDVLTFAIRIANPSTAGLTVDVDERLAEGLEYMDASFERSSVGEDVTTVGAVPAASDRDGTFARDGNELRWRGVDLAAGEVVTIRYRSRVLPTAPLELMNTTVATGTSANGAEVASSVATTAFRLDLGVFDRNHGVLTGRAFMDFDGDGRFTAGVDDPLDGVRLVLGGARQVLSDERGLYVFRGVPVGMHGLLVDASSLPFTLRSHPAMLAPNRYDVRVQGVTVHDLAAAPPMGRATVDMTTRVEIGPITVERVVTAGEEGDVVTLTLDASEPVVDATVRDRMADGSPWIHTIDRLDGRVTIRFDAGGEADPNVPTVDWRFP